MAFVMDGNRRFAETRRISVKKGHQMGIETLEQRSPEEVAALMDIAKAQIFQLSRSGGPLQRWNAKLQVLGRQELLRSDVQEALRVCSDSMSQGNEFVLNICMPYTSRDEIAMAVQQTVRQHSRPSDTGCPITEESLSNNMLPAMSDPTIPIACQNLLHDWANLLDTKSWAQMPAIFAPSIDVDYSSLGQIKATGVQPSVYIDHYASPTQLGNPEVQSHHFIGACKWTRESESHVRVVFQIMAVHRRTPQHGDAVLATGHGVNTMDFAQVDGEWKITGIKVTLLWFEGDFDGIFEV
ncbi:hypothetical protein APSETT444_002949 [Aspergillus pseudonomiae]